MKKLFLLLSLGFSFGAYAQTDVAPQPDLLNQLDIIANAAITHVEELSADKYNGRRTGTKGNEMAASYIKSCFREYGLLSFKEDYESNFSFTSERINNGNEQEAVNLIAYLEGKQKDGPHIVIGAHYDHLGVRDGKIFNGADDNASGISGLLAAAQYFSKNQPEHTLVFVAFDAEEVGLQGAKAYVEEPALPLSKLALMINMDMISISPKKELFAVGTAQYPYLKPYLQKVEEPAGLQIVFGHDTPTADPYYDWSQSSDHGPFFNKGVAGIYFGVEDHAHYHKHTDDFSEIDRSFLSKAITTVIRFVAIADRSAAAILATRK